MRGLLGLAVMAGTLIAGPYRDPQGRFTVPVPDGWTAQAAGQDVLSTSNGRAYVMLTLIGRGDPDQVADGPARQVARQWTRLQEVKRGLGWRVFYGTNRNGVPAFLRIAVVPRGPGMVTFLSSAPEREFPAAR